MVKLRFEPFPSGPETVENRPISYSDVEYTRYLDFCGKHSDCGSYIRVEFSFSGIGTGVDVECDGCGAREDLTHYESW
jgi:hypothetical protein